LPWLFFPFTVRNKIEARTSPLIAQMSADFLRIQDRRGDPQIYSLSAVITEICGGSHKTFFDR